MIPKLNYRAIRAYNKIYAPIAKRQWFGSQCDYQVDFGEWSSSAYYHISETIEERIAEYVGARFGLSAEELRHQVWIADNIHNDCYFARKLGERVGLVNRSKLMKKFIFNAICVFIAIIIIGCAVNFNILRDYLR